MTDNKITYFNFFNLICIGILPTCKSGVGGVGTPGAGVFLSCHESAGTEPKSSGRVDSTLALAPSLQAKIAPFNP